jgi:predicted ArsR family transcriptional regulator
MERDRVTIQEAARRLGISESGVRKRVKRGQLDSTHEGGRVFVYLDTSRSDGQEEDSVRDTVRDKEIERLVNHIASLERQLEESNVRDRENRRTIIALTSRIPELESPENVAAPRQSEEPPAEAESPENQSSRPWWAFWRS